MLSVCLLERFDLWHLYSLIDLDLRSILWKIQFGEGSDVVGNQPLLKDIRLPDRLGTQGDSWSFIDYRRACAFGESPLYTLLKKFLRPRFGGFPTS